ncbi:hypothetical protein INT43_002617 [Umbelopsis isabellina]|uniref:Hydrophobin n=1 Tax=Mortierella isabellina TaxID=91625 RepID=A0A8H7Q465_MORIS|nr:hypothetical protein INT43_002617 [Umbelopsis isabellina]
MKFFIIWLALSIHSTVAFFIPPPSGGQQTKTQTGFFKCVCQGSLDESIQLATGLACNAASGFVLTYNQLGQKAECGLDGVNKQNFIEVCQKLRINADCVNINAFV